MTVSTKEQNVQTPVKATLNDEFQRYLKKQTLKTTFNGFELETFGWYKKVLGLV